MDDILPFADSAEHMEEIKIDILSKWKTKNMGEPIKIVGIKIIKLPAYHRSKTFRRY